MKEIRFTAERLEFIAGRYYRSDTSIVLCTNPGNKSIFSGVVIASSTIPVYKYSRCLKKQNFSPFNGEIRLIVDDTKQEPAIKGNVYKSDSVYVLCTQDAIYSNTFVGAVISSEDKNTPVFGYSTNWNRAEFEDCGALRVHLNSQSKAEQ